MASAPFLLVVIVSETGLRTTLVARLSMAGADMLTADNLSDPRLARYGSRPMVLIADEAAVSSHEGGVAALAADPRWARLVLISPEAPPAGKYPHLVHIERAGAAALEALLPEWQTLDAAR